MSDAAARPSAQDLARIGIEEMVARLKGSAASLDDDARNRIEVVTTRFALLATDAAMGRAAPDEIDRRKERLLATAAADLAIVQHVALAESRAAFDAGMAALLRVVIAAVVAV